MNPIIATPDSPVTIYYCKANLKTGLTVRIVQGSRSWDTSGVTLSGDCFFAEMIHGNSTGKAKKSGARCTLIITSGMITPT